jgi:2-methylcitrate dehydratase PrpD
VDATVRALRASGGTGPVPVFGRGETFDALGAALVNGTGSAVLDFDSTQLRKTNIHPSGPVLPALFAWAAAHEIDRREFTNAFVLGVEVSCRIANSVFGRSNSGWHVTGVAGGIGAAVAVGKAMKLPLEKLISAIAIAANQACGLRETYGTMCKALTPGRAAQSGLLAATLAAEGFTGPVAPLEGGKGFVRVFTGADADSEMTDGLGDTYEITWNNFKPYPCAIVTHATIDGCIQIRQAHAIDTSAIESVELTVPPVAIDLAGKTEPKTELESKFSLGHCAAVALLHGRVLVDHFAEEAFADPAVKRLGQLTRAKADPALRKTEARVRVTLQNGAAYDAYVEHALGSLEKPMTDADVAAKFRGLCEPTIGAERTSRLLSLCEDLPANMRDLAAA